MNRNTLQGDLANGRGRVEGAAGALLDDPALEAKGAARRFGGDAQTSLGQVQAAVAQAADQAKAAASKVGDAYGRATGAAQDVADTVDPFVRERPYAALAIAAASGLLLGLLFAGRGPKVIYVKPRV